MMIVNLKAILVLELTAGLLVLMISFLSPGIAVYFLIFSMLLSPEIVMASLPQRDITLRMDDLLISVIALGWLARNAVFKELGLFVKTPLNKPILYYVLACVFATALGILFGKVRPLQGTMFVLKYIEYFFVFFIVAGSIRDREQVKRYLLAMCLTLVVVSVYAIMQIPSGERIDVVFGGKSGEPNTLGGYLVFMIAILSGMFFSHDSLKIRLWSLALMALAAVPLLYTLSRSSWMALAATYASLLFFSRKAVVLIAALLIGISFAGMLIPEKVGQRYGETFMKRPLESPQQVKVGDVYLDQSASERINSYMKILEDIKNRPVFGYGVTGYGFVDGQFFRTLIETGIIGFAAFGFLLYKILSAVFRAFHDAEDELFKGIGLGVLAGICGLMAHALSANTFIIVRIMEPFWLVMGMITAGIGLMKQDMRKAAGHGKEKRFMTDLRDSGSNEILLQKVMGIAII